jgi:cellobiose phosphorylase
MLITGQCSTGGAMSVVKPFSHKPGKEKLPAETEYRSDDCLWLFNSIDHYVAESGDVAYYDKVLPYADKGEATVFGHLRRAIEFNLERSGVHGLPCGLLADWNDCLKLGFKGETTFVAFQLRYALDLYIRVAEMLKKPGEAQWAAAELKKLDAAIQKHTWDGEYFVRAWREDGSVIGSHTEEEGAIFLNPQSWAVISGSATPEQGVRAMDSVKEKLATEYGAMVCAPPFIKTDYHVVRAVLMNEGTKENGGIFSHTQGWAVMAECVLGRGDRAMEYYRAYMPAAQNDKAEIREIEPYVHCQSTHSIYSRRYGASRIPWLSGTASWSYYSAIAHILGLRPEYRGFTIDPCVPSAWKGFTARRKFRGKTLNIRVENPKGVQKGVQEIVLNGESIKGCFIPIEKIKDRNEVVVKMG